MGRAPCCSKVGLHRGPWTAREDALLIKYIQDHGEGQWRSLPKKAGLLRCGKSCRLRWMNYLRPDIKRGNITPDEDDLIIRLHGLLGNRWSLIAGRLPGRTDNEIKNYWNTHLSKKLLSQGTDPNTHKKITQFDTGKGAKSTKKKSRSSISNKTSKKSKAQKLKDENTSEETMERTKIHSPKPVRVKSVISLTRNNSNGSFETHLSTNTSASSSQSQISHQNQSRNQQYGLVSFDSSENSNVILDMPWLSSSNHLISMCDDENGLDHLIMMGSCGDHEVNLDITHHNHVEVTARDNNQQELEKLYEEYLQLIKADHHHRDNHDDVHDDGDEAHLDSFTKSFLI